MDSKDKFIQVENSSTYDHLEKLELPCHTLVGSQRRSFRFCVTSSRQSAHYRTGAKVVAVTGSLLPDGKTSTLVVTRNPLSNSGVNIEDGEIIR